MSKPVLHYFDIAGLAEPIRIALFIAGIDFEDRRIQRGDWPTVKAGFPLGQVPVMEIDGEKYTQSKALLRFYGRKAGLYTDDLQLKIDEILEIQGEVMYKLPREGAPDVLKKQREEWVEKVLKPEFGYINGRIEKFGKTYALGDELTIADLILAGAVQFFSSGWLDYVDSKIMSTFPAIVKAAEATQKNPKIEEYKKSVRPTLHYFNFGGRAEAIRLALFVSGTEYNEKILDFPTFKDVKGEYPLGQVPVVDINGRRVTQTNALLRFYGRKGGLYPDETQLAIDEILEIVAELQYKVPASDKDLRAKFVEEKFKPMFAYIDKLIAANNKAFAVSDKLTIADLQLFTSVEFWRSGFVDHVDKTAVDAFPNILRVHAAVKAAPKVSEYYAKKQ